MRTLQQLAIFLIVALMAAPSLQAQSKKTLRETISQLETEVQTLTQENNQMDIVNERLRQENQAYVEQNSTLRSQVGQLQRENDAMRADNEALVNENETLKGRVDALTSLPAGGGTTGGFPTTGGGGGTVDPNDTRKCAHYQGRLSPGLSYTENYGALNSDGWGLQVYASSNLCQAAEKAETFKSKYRLYKTYIRCKEVNGTYIYAVVYGSLREREQAKTYLNNFKKISGSWGANAFLVQH
jgi:type II secretory pathway pseudopilin PulG